MFITPMEYFSTYTMLFAPEALISRCLRIRKRVNSICLTLTASPDFPEKAFALLILLWPGLYFTLRSGYSYNRFFLRRRHQYSVL